jgi:hypothetical protein
MLCGVPGDELPGVANVGRRGEMAKVGGGAAYHLTGEVSYEGGGSEDLRGAEALASVWATVTKGREPGATAVAG